MKEILIEKGLKLLKIVGNLLLFIVYPHKKAINFLYGLVSDFTKLLSVERSEVSGRVFGTYFDRNVEIKKLEQNSEVSVQVSEIGGLISLFKTNLFETYTLLGLIYFIMPFFIGSVIFGFITNATNYQNMQEMAVLGVLVAFILGVYYLFVMSVIFVKMFTENVYAQQADLKMMLNKEFEYYFLKSLDFDEQIAKLTMSQIVETVLLNNISIDVQKSRKNDFENLINQKIGA